MKIIERSVQEIGQSFLVSLPKDWTRTLHIRKGSILKMTVSDRGILCVFPEFSQPTTHRETTIVYDEHFQRRFFREYFEGNETITVLQVREQDRKMLREFLDRFMNVQIIEETNRKILVKCFTIHELSMQECLQRMHFLSLNILE